MRTSLLLVELAGLGWVGLVGLVGLGLQWPLISSGLNDPNPRSFEWVLKIKKNDRGFLVVERVVVIALRISRKILEKGWGISENPKGSR